MIQFPYYKAYSIWPDFPDYFQCKPFIAITIILQLIVEWVGNVTTENFFFLTRDADSSETKVTETECVDLTAFSVQEGR